MPLFGRICAKVYSAFQALRSNARRVSGSLAKDLMRNGVLDDSAGMVYATVISIVPFFITVFPFLQALGVFEGIYGAAKAALSETMGEDSFEYVSEVVRGYVANGSSLGFYGFLIYSFSAVRLVNRVKGLFGKVYRIRLADNERGVLLVSLKYLLYIVAFALFLALIGFLWSFLFSGSSPYPRSGLLGSRLIRRFFFLTAIVTVCFFLFQSMPRIYVSSRVALEGSLFFMAELVILNAVMSFVSRMAVRSMSIVYGYAANLIIALIWLNWFWKLLIVAVDFAYIVQYDPDTSGVKSLDVSVCIKDSIEIMRMIVMGFKTGKGGARLSDISAQLSISSQQVIEICDKFVDANLIHAVGKLRNRLYAPAIPTGEIKVFYALKAVQGNWPSDGAGAKVMDRIFESEMEDFLDVAVEDLK